MEEEFGKCTYCGRSLDLCKDRYRDDLNMTVSVGKYTVTVVAVTYRCMCGYNTTRMTRADVAYHDTRKRDMSVRQTTPRKN